MANTKMPWSVKSTVPIMSSDGTRQSGTVPTELAGRRSRSDMDFKGSDYGAGI
jgi:hypothetical protein